MNLGTVARLVLVVAGVTSAAAGAQGFGGGPGGGQGFGNHQPPMARAFGSEGARKGWWNNPRIAEHLKLTDDQRKAMDAIMLEHREKLIDLRANLEKAELAMQSLMGADTPNDPAITAQIDKVVLARGDLEKANARFLLAIRDKLTPDQWKLVQSFRDNGGMRGEQRERMGPDGAPGPGGQFRRLPPPPPSPDMPGPGPGPGAEQ
jgi:Spy/CpxP family protein refolding chaperone